ncbi:hypothetical protein [Microbispora sp. NPDC049125]|uniref:hypothetical protein n=1 Tax=Microbispora sp. NPDC049125 TaxID=3154929 RepID=UPI0034668BA2
MTDSNNGVNPEGRRRDPLGSAAEEAFKLLDAVQQRVGREFGKGLVKGSMSGFGSAFGGAGAGRGAGASPAADVWSEAVGEGHGDEYICRACPVCRVIAARKEAGGDVADHLFAAGGELFAALRQAVDALQRPASRGPGGERPEGPRVERIDLS